LVGTEKRRTWKGRALDPGDFQEALREAGSPNIHSDENATGFGILWSAALAKDQKIWQLL